MPKSLPPESTALPQPDVRIHVRTGLIHDRAYEVYRNHEIDLVTHYRRVAIRRALQIADRVRLTGLENEVLWR